VLSVVSKSGRVLDVSEMMIWTRDPHIAMRVLALAFALLALSTAPSVDAARHLVSADAPTADEHIGRAEFVSCPA
jgi:hypothetical protein